MSLRFSNPESREVHQTIFEARKFREGESLGDLASDIQRLARLAMPEADRKCQNDQARFRFVAGLGPQPAVAVMRCKTKTLEEALSAAREEQALFGWGTAASVPFPVPTVSAVIPTEKIDNLTASLAALTKQMGRMEEEMRSMRNDLDKARGAPTMGARRPPWDDRRAEDQRGERKQGRFSGKCYQCNEFGHLRRNCTASRDNREGRDVKRGSGDTLASSDDLRVRQPSTRTRTGHRDTSPCSRCSSTTTGRYVNLNVVNKVTPACVVLVNGLLGQRKTSMLVDTGAAVSLVREDVWRKSDPEAALDKYAESLSTAAGGNLAVIWSYKVTITLGTRSYQHRVLIVPVLSHPVLLENDFLKPQLTDILFSKSEIRLSGGIIVPFVPSTPHVTEMSMVTAAVTFTLPPESGTMIQGEARGSFKHDLCLMEPARTLVERHGVITAGTLVYPNYTGVPVRILKAQLSVITSDNL
ncbi:hypothetical protein B566_EDAN016454 [Ephemera danica]|nr:hypothetical protein B566_EDAN016454 [Ephemera danica]